MAHAAAVEAAAAAAPQQAEEVVHPVHPVLPAPSQAHFEAGNTVFVEEFRIRGNEAGPDQKANIITIANMLQVGVWGEAAACSVDQTAQSWAPVTCPGAVSVQQQHGVCCVHHCECLQEVGGNHGVAMWGRSSTGFASMPGMDHLIFVATRMQIRMEAYPMW